VSHQQQPWGCGPQPMGCINNSDQLSRVKHQGGKQLLFHGFGGHHVCVGHPTTTFMRVRCLLSAPPAPCHVAEGAAGAGAQVEEGEAERGGRRRVRRPRLSPALGRSLRQGPLQAEAQPQAHRQPAGRQRPREARHQAQLLNNKQ